MGEGLHPAPQLPGQGPRHGAGVRFLVHSRKSSSHPTEACSAKRLGFPGGASGKEPTCQGRDIRTSVSIPRLGRSPGGRHSNNPAPVSSPGEPHGQRSLAGCSQGGCKESDRTEVTKRTHGPRARQDPARRTHEAHRRRGIWYRFLNGFTEKGPFSALTWKLLPLRLSW